MILVVSEFDIIIGCLLKEQWVKLLMKNSKEMLNIVELFIITTERPFHKKIIV